MNRKEFEAWLALEGWEPFWRGGPTATIRNPGTLRWIPVGLDLIVRNAASYSRNGMVDTAPCAGFDVICESIMLGIARELGVEYEP